MQTCCYWQVFFSSVVLSGPEWFHEFNPNNLWHDPIYMWSGPWFGIVAPSRCTNLWGWEEAGKSTRVQSVAIWKTLFRREDQGTTTPDTIRGRSWTKDKCWIGISVFFKESAKVLTVQMPEAKFSKSFTSALLWHFYPRNSYNMLIYVNLLPNFQVKITRLFFLPKEPETGSLL